MPQVYSGDEIAMQGGEDPDNRRNFPGGFRDARDAKEDAFVSTGRTPREQETFAWASTLFAFRKQHTVLQTGEQQNIFLDDDAFAFIRTPGASRGCSGTDQDAKLERFLIVINKSVQPRQVAINTQETAAEGCLHFDSALNGNSNSIQRSKDGTTVTVLLSSGAIGLYRMH